MPTDLPDLLLSVLCVASLGALLYLLVAIGQVSRFRVHPDSPVLEGSPPITVLIPIRGESYGLYENLTSFCAQEYTRFQLVFGVDGDRDPALPIIRRVITEWPERELTLTVGGGEDGGNQKVGKLIRMFSAARYDIIAVADSDVRADRHGLARLAGQFADAQVGAVSFFYCGVPDTRLGSRLLALFINEWFFPSVLVARSLAEPRFCLGALMAARRAALEAIGGFAVLEPYLADDYMLGNLIGRQGYRVRLAPCMVEHRVAEPSVKAALVHELRWSRTIQACAPVGHAFSFIGNNALTLTFLLALASGFRPLGLALFAFAIALRVALHFKVYSVLTHRPGLGDLLLLPVRDVLCFAVWAASFWSRGITWGGRQYRLQAGGRLSLEGGNLK
jgi:ceramide glucosyltransferase